MTADSRAGPLRLLITAGPTHEPIDAVRFLGNRSSGRLGIALADRAAELGWEVTLLLGPSQLMPTQSAVRLARFRTAAELGSLLEAGQPHCDVLVMAAAVADYRPRTAPEQLAAKLRRGSDRLTLELEPTGDLLAACAERRRAGQLLIGFALEPSEGLSTSAREKLERKGIDLIVANPLSTMESETIDALVLSRDGAEESTGGPMEKRRFADWLLAIIARRATREDAPGGAERR